MAETCEAPPATAGPRLWFSGGIYVEDPEHRKPNRSKTPGGFAAAVECVPDAGGEICLRFELSDTEKKDNVDPFAEGGIGGHVDLALPSLKPSCAKRFSCNFVRLETVYPKRDGDAVGEFTGLGFLTTHGQPNSAKALVRYFWQKIDGTPRVVGVSVRIPDANFNRALAGARLAAYGRE